MLCSHVVLLSSIFLAFDHSASAQSPLASTQPSLSAEEDLFFREFLEAADDVLPDSADAIKEHFAKTREVLGPIIEASPKNKHGRLDESGARYALYRVFMERHGWVIRNFDLTGETLDKRSSMFSFGEFVPTPLQIILDDRVRHRGSGIVELSLFVSMLEFLIDDDTVQSLERLFSLKRLPVDGRVVRWQAESVIDLFMASYISGLDMFKLTLKDVLNEEKLIASSYHNWEGTKKFFRGIMDSHVSKTVTLTFDDISRVLVHIVDNFVYWNNEQCHSYKDKLKEIEGAKTPGRVRLLDFYRSAIKENGTSTFLESIDYLRQLGDLDESNYLNPQVLMSNYLEGPNNCVARTSFYSVCCMDECADLYSHLEHSLGKPAAMPSEIVPIVESLNSASMGQCQVLSSELRQSLHDIVDDDGKVLLHGKDFQEWMHKVYPRECASAKNFGPAHAMIIEEWMDRTKISPQTTYSDITSYVAKLERYEKRMIAGMAVSEKATADSGKTKASTATDVLERDQKKDKREWSPMLTWTFLFFVMSMGVLSWKLHRDEGLCIETRDKKAELHLTELF